MKELLTVFICSNEKRPVEQEAEKTKGEKWKPFSREPLRAASQKMIAITIMITGCTQSRMDTQ